VDYSVAIAFLKKSDPILAKLIEQVGDCQLDQNIQSGDLLYLLSRSIFYQQLSGKAAAAIHQRFLQLYSDQLPTALDILNTPDEILRNVGISRPKISYLKDLSQKIIDGLSTLDELETMDDESIIKTLTPIKGIGRWTVQMLLIFGFHRWDVLPLDDLGIRAGIRQLYALSELPNKKTVENIAQKWKPYRTIACWYLWQG
jgi:DNA-3-methyladenine glycosylase II